MKLAAIAALVWLAAGSVQAEETQAPPIDLARYRPIDLTSYAFRNSDHRYDGSHYLIVMPMAVVPKDDATPEYKLEAKGGATVFPVGVIGGNPMSRYFIPRVQQMWVELQNLPAEELAALVERCPPITRCTARWYVTVLGTRNRSVPQGIPDDYIELSLDAWR